MVDTTFWEFSTQGQGLLNPIEVIPLSSDPSRPGLQFVTHGQLATTEENRFEIIERFSYRVETTGPELFTEASLDLTAFSGPGSLWIREDPEDAEPTGDLDVRMFVSPPVLTDSYSFGVFFPKDSLKIFTEIVVLYDGGSIDSFTQRFNQTQAPEPTTILLGGTGLVGLAGFRRKFRQ